MTNKNFLTLIKLMALWVILGMQACNDTLGEKVSSEDAVDIGVVSNDVKDFFYGNELAVLPIEFSSTCGDIVSGECSAEAALNVLWDKAVEVNHSPRIVEAPLETPACPRQAGKTESWLVMQKIGENAFFCFVKTEMLAGQAGKDKLVLLSTLAGRYSNAYLQIPDGKRFGVKMRIQGEPVVCSRSGNEPDSVLPTAGVATGCGVCGCLPCVCPPAVADTTTPTPATPGPTTPGETTSSTPTVIGDSIIVTIETSTSIVDFLICSLCHSYPCLCPEKPETEEVVPEVRRCSYCGSTSCSGQLRWNKGCNHFHCTSDIGDCALCQKSSCICCKNCICPKENCQCRGQLCWHNVNDPCVLSLNAEFCTTCKGGCKCLPKGQCFHTMPCKYFNSRYCENCEQTCTCLDKRHCDHTEPCEGFVR